MRILTLISLTLFALTSVAQISLPNPDSKPAVLRTAPAVVLNNDSALTLMQAQYIGPIERVETVFDSLQRNIHSRIDSLENIHQLDSGMMKNLLTLQSKIDSLRTIAVNAINSDVVISVTALDDVNEKLQNMVGEKLAWVEHNSGENVKRRLESLNTVSPLIKPIALPDETLLNHLVGLPETPVASISIPEIDVSLPDITEVSMDGTQGARALEKLDQLDQLLTGPEVLESKIEDLVQLDEVKAQLAEADKLKRYFDPEVAKEEAINKAKLEAVNHFAGHEEELKAAMEKLSQLKSKIPDPDGVIDLFAKRQRTMHGKSFSHRLIPGLTIQLQKQRSAWVDINPYLGFRITGRLTWGLGWNERFAFDTKVPGWKKNERIFGPRSLVHFKLRENLWLKGDFEKMNVAHSSDPKLQTWVWSCFAGIKKDFRLSKRLSGNMQLLYSWHDPGHPNPYAERINVRIGFELPKLGKDN